MSCAQLIAEVVRGGGANSDQALAQLKLQIARQQLSPADCRSALEAACFLSVQRRDRAGLQRHLAQLKPWAGGGAVFFAVELLLLLVQSRLGDFFALLETASAEQAESPHVRFVVLLERNLTEGSYHKALTARAQSTSPEWFAWLLEDLEQTVRDEVAGCLEVSYANGLSQQRARELLKLEGDDDNSLAQFAAQREWTLLDVDGGRVAFPQRAPPKLLSKKSIPTDSTIRECLHMAVELDRIV